MRGERGRPGRSVYRQGLSRCNGRAYGGGMDQREEIRDFLRSRRAKISPERVNLPGGGYRRVPGLRREEVAMLAGVSVDYYARLERGSLEGVSDEVLGSIARTLELDDAETAHLFDLARGVRQAAVPRRRPSQAQHVRPSVQRLLDGWVGVPAWVRNERMDVLAANPLGRALYSELFASAEPGRAPNNARFVFLDPRSREFYPEWDQGANDLVAILRGSAGRNPHDRLLMELIGELSTRSDEFRMRWANHNVRFHRTGAKRLHHPVVGDLELAYEAMELPADPGLTMFAYTAEPASATEERLRLLASWAATHPIEGADAEASARPS
jgi:transcriptional regulator with XRE-family HTH domain